MRASGCVNFGGSVTVDVSLLPKNDSSITLMTFNCSTGSFTLLGNDNPPCSQQLHYLPHALVFELQSFDACRGEDSIPYIWVLYIFIALFVVGIGVVVLFLILRNNKKLKNVKDAQW